MLRAAAARGGGPRDAKAQREANANAPKIDHLLRRVGELFKPHRLALSITIALVLISAAISVAPPLLTRQLFDVGLFPPNHHPNVPVLLTLIGIMVALWVISSALGV